MENYFFAAVVAFMLSFGLARFACWFFPRVGLMDRPHKYGLKRKPIPYYGGLVLYVSFVVTTLLFVPISPTLVVFLLASTLIMLVSFWDDWRGLSPWLRLFFQMTAALLLVLVGVGIVSLSNPLGDPLLLDQLVVVWNGIEIAILSALFTVIWVIAFTNTMNFLDGLQGLPSGITVIAGVTLFGLSIRPDIHYDAALQVPVAFMSIILAAVALAFWMFDFYPAKILMGDTGSMFLGFVVATLAIFSGGKIATAFLVMGFPLLDAAWVLLRRILKGQSPLKGDLQHLHHRLLKAGLSQRQALLILYAFSALFGSTAIFLQGIYKMYALIMLFVVMTVVGFIVVRKGKQSS